MKLTTRRLVATALPALLALAMAGASAAPAMAFKLGMAVGGGALLSACGGGGSGATETGAVVVPSAPIPTSSAEPASPGTTSAINLALTLAYIGAQFYGVAAQGTGLAPAGSGTTFMPARPAGRRRVGCGPAPHRRGAARRVGTTARRI